MPAMPPPKFATARDLSRATRGTRQGDFARIWLGQPLMPWQQLVLDVSGELRPDGLPVYPLVVVTVQRQAGKSHLAMARKGERCFSQPGFRSWYTAQTGGDARDQFLKFQTDVIDGTPLAKVVRTLVGNGREVMQFPNGSWLRPHPPTKKALHGKQSDDNDVDEAWAFSEEEGTELMQAIAPTQLTRPGAQTWILSAGGTAQSTWLASLVARGRDGDPGICYFEWGIPDDLALDDLEAIAAHHPAYGHTVTVDGLANLRTQLTDDSEFARAAGNRWTEIIGGAITAEQWQSVRWSDPIPEGVPVGYGAARSADGSQVAIATAAEVDGQIVVEILDVLPTAYRAAEHVDAWASDGPLAVDPNGPSAGLASDLEKRRPRNLMLPTSAQAGAAVVTLLDSLKPRAIRFRQHPQLDAAVKVAGTRPLGDGGKAWARLAAGAPIAALEAGCLAAWAVSNRPQSVGRPRLIMPSAA